MPNFEIFSLADSALWEDSLTSLYQSQSDVYFTPQYHQIFEQLGDGKACCFVFRHANEIYIKPFLINPVSSLGLGLQDEYFDIQSVYGYTGPLVSTRDQEFLASAHSTFHEYCKSENIIAEFTRFHPLLANYEVEPTDQVLPDRDTVVVDLLSGYEDIWTKHYSGNARNMIRKAQKLDYRCEFAMSPSHEQIKRFAALYAMNMTKVAASAYYFFSEQFFFDTFSCLNENVVLINVLDSQNVTVASTLLLRRKPYLHYHLSARLPEIDNSVNSYLIDSIVRYGTENGYERLHLGGGRTGAPDDSLLKFKRNFSKTIARFYIGKKVNNMSAYYTVVERWAKKYPEKSAINKNVLLKYRL